MSEGNFERLLSAKKDSALVFRSERAAFALCPDLGGRVFAQIGGQTPHRMDFDSIENPTTDFNNYGGGNFWPAPEGGKFGFNYEGDNWVVQEAVNLQPFEVVQKSENGAVISKKSTLTNRLGTQFSALVRRTFSLCEPDGAFCDMSPEVVAAYETVDEFELLDKVTVDKALIASWTLEQFAAAESTVAFCTVDEPENAINFDFYELPGDRIQYAKHGFTYKTDGKKAGQIGVKVCAKPVRLGFYDTVNHLLCIRQNVVIGDGVYFNIADNDQPEGPYSAADCYSVFNSDPEMGAFELETIGSARILGNVLLGSRLVSRTTFAVFEDNRQIDDYLEQVLK